MRLPDEVRKRLSSTPTGSSTDAAGEQVAAGERGAVFDVLVADQSFSGPLRPYMTEGQIRVWLKDSAAKEYPRALEGIGGTAQFTPRRYPGPGMRSFRPRRRSVDRRRRVDRAETDAMHCQGARRGLRHAIPGPAPWPRDPDWAASRVRALSTGRVAIAITRPTMAPLPADEWTNAKALCELIGVDLFSVMYAPRAVCS